MEPECSEQFFDGEKSIAVQGIAYLDDEAGGLPELLSLLDHFLAGFFYNISEEIRDLTAYYTMVKFM